MTTAAQAVTAILKSILVVGDESAIEASEAQDTIFAMNNYMLAQDALGVTLGYTVVADLGDTITVPPGAIQGLIANVAVMAAPQFDVVASQELLEQARIGLKAMRRLSNTTILTSFPCTLPIGAGNESTGWENEHFYACSDDEVLAETNGSIGLESGTNEAS